MGTYEFDGEKYEQASGHQKVWGQKLLSDLRLDGNESILDLGCGDGVLTEQLAHLVPDGSVIGIDASSGMIKTANKRIRNNLQFLYMDMTKMNFMNQFDVIYSNAALHWVKDHSLLLKRSYAALKPGGKILWNFAGEGNCSDFFEVIRNIIHAQPYKKYFATFEWPWYMPSKSEYKELIKFSDFTDAIIIEENADQSFSNADEMIRWIDQPSIVPFLKYIPSEEKAVFRSKVIDACLQKALQPDGTCFQAFRRLKISASKQTVVKHYQGV